MTTHLAALEMEQLLNEWNATDITFATPDYLHALFEAQAESTPDATAIVCRAERITYGQLNQRANQLAHYLRQLGVRPDTLVGIYLDRSIDAVVAILGVLKAGGAYLPLDSTYPKERIAFIATDARAPLLLTRRSLAADLGAVIARVISLDTDQYAIESHLSVNPRAVNKPDNVAFVLYTSGSTGNPKGVMITHANMLNNLFAWEHTHRLRETINGVCQTAHFSFAVFQGDVFRALSSGKELVICPNETLLSSRALYALMRHENANFGEFVPTLVRSLIDFAKSSGERLDFMKVVIVSADRWYVREHLELKDLCGPDTRVVHVYGLSETTLDSTYFTSTTHALSPTELTPIGRPFPNVRIHLLDADRQPVPIGVAGDIYVGGAGISKGYLYRPELTSERFITDPSGTNTTDRLYYTGDLARYLPDGNIAFLGRHDHQVKIRGFRVEPGEIEARLEAHPGVKSAIVQAWEPAPGRTQLVGYYVTREDSDPGKTALQSFVGAKLPDFMVPTYLVRLDTLPLTPSGKVDRGALPPPPSVSTVQTSSPSPTGGEFEHALAAICRHALGVPAIEPDQSFTLLGIDSMAIMSMVAGIEQAFGIAVDDEDINTEVFASISSLAAYIRKKRD